MKCDLWPRRPARQTMRIRRGAGRLDGAHETGRSSDTTVRTNMLSLFLGQNSGRLIQRCLRTVVSRAASACPSEPSTRPLWVELAEDPPEHRTEQCEGENQNRYFSCGVTPQ